MGLYKKNELLTIDEVNNLSQVSMNKLLRLKDINFNKLSEISLTLKENKFTTEKSKDTLRIEMFKCYEYLAWIDYMFLTNSFTN